MVNLFWLCKPKRVVVPSLSGTSSGRKRGRASDVSWDYSACARQHIDSHIIKIPLEAAQLLYGVHHKMPAKTDWINSAPLTLSGVRGYRPAHIHNPISNWATENLMHYRHAVYYGLALCKEYTHRYKRTHACEEHLEWLRLNEPAIPCDPSSIRDPPLAMPDQYKLVSDPTVDPLDDYLPSDEVDLGSTDAHPTQTAPALSGSPPQPISKRRRRNQPASSPPAAAQVAPAASAAATQPASKRRRTNQPTSANVAAGAAAHSTDYMFSWQVYQSYRNYYLGEKLKIRMSGFGDRAKPVWVQAHLDQRGVSNSLVSDAGLPAGSDSD